MKSSSSKQLPTSEVVAAMGRLLSDHVLREEFRRAPRQVVQQLGLSGAELEYIVRLDPVGLERQAETLLQKRWHEVARLLPATIAGLEDEAEGLFRYYASASWPQGHRRHILDARAFVQFLERNQLGDVNGRERRRIYRPVFSWNPRSWLRPKR